MNFQISFRSRFAAAEHLALANALQLSTGHLPSRLRLNAPHIEAGDSTIAYITQPELNLLAKVLQLEGSPFVTLGQQAEGFPYDLAGRLVCAAPNFLINQFFKLRSKGNVHGWNAILDNK
jgi:hypothetical protein